MFDVEHFCGSPPFAIRLTTPEGKTVAYSGDTEWTQALFAVADNVDLFIVEAYFFDKLIKWHLDYNTLARHAAGLNARRVIATHLSAEMLDRLDEVQMEVARDGLTIDI